MNRTYLRQELKNYVQDRAEAECEYCLRPSFFSDQTYHIDHIIGLTHGGWSTEDNLAWSCPECNTWKGTNLATYLATTGEIIQLYHPRRHTWATHFDLLRTGLIISKSKIGDGTVELLLLNEARKVEERKAMLLEGYTFFVLK